jgi:hypothetical protein
MIPRRPVLLLVFVLIAFFIFSFLFFSKIEDGNYGRMSDTANSITPTVVESSLDKYFQDGFDKEIEKAGVKKSGGNKSCNFGGNTVQAGVAVFDEVCSPD